MIERGVPLTLRAFVQRMNLQIDEVGRDVALVLDDFQAIRTADTLAVIGELMRHPHPRLHLVLVSRHDPQLPLSKWRAHNQMADIRSGDLRFSLEETTAFLHGATDRSLDNAAIARLHTNTEGWAAGLRMAALSLSYAQDEDAGQILELRGSNLHTLEFLAEQVMGALPAPWQLFLVRTSILGRLSGPLCEAVAPAPQLDGQALLRDMYRENLFLIPLDSEQQWYRYHYLFGEFLRSRLARECSPEEIAGLHLQASRWLGGAGFVEEAIRHAHAADNTREAILLFAANRQQLFNEERFGRLLVLDRLFSEEAVRSSPNLLLMEAWLAFSLRFDATTMGYVSHEVDALLDKLDIEPEMERVLRAESDAVKGMVAYFSLDHDAALAYSRQALQDLPLSYYTVRSLARVYGAGALQMQGKLSEALEYMWLGQAEDLAPSDFPRGRNLGTTAFIYWIAGDLGGVERVGEHMLNLLSPDSHSISRLWAYYFLASAHYHRNDLAKARYYAEHAFEGRLSNSGYFAVYAGIVLAMCHEAAGNTARADEVMTQIRATAVALQSAPLLAVAGDFEIELDVARRRLDHALPWAEQRLPVTPLAPLPMFYAPQLTVAKALLAANDPAKASLLGDYLRQWRVQLGGHSQRALPDRGVGYRGAPLCCFGRRSGGGGRPRPLACPGRAVGLHPPLRRSRPADGGAARPTASDDLEDELRQPHSRRVWR